MKRDCSVAIEDSFIGNEGTETEEEREEKLSRYVILQCFTSSLCSPLMLLASIINYNIAMPYCTVKL